VFVHAAKTHVLVATTLYVTRPVIV